MDKDNDKMDFCLFVCLFNSLWDMSHFILTYGVRVAYTKVTSLFAVLSTYSLFDTLDKFVKHPILFKSSSCVRSSFQAVVQLAMKVGHLFSPAFPQHGNPLVIAKLYNLVTRQPQLPPLHGVKAQ